MGTRILRRRFGNIKGLSIHTETITSTRGVSMGYQIRLYRWVPPRDLWNMITPLSSTLGWYSLSGQCTNFATSSPVPLPSDLWLKWVYPLLSLFISTHTLLVGDGGFLRPLVSSPLEGTNCYKERITVCSHDPSFIQGLLLHLKRKTWEGLRRDTNVKLGRVVEK